MSKTMATRYDVAEHLRTPEEMAAFLEACLEEAEGDAVFIAKALGDIRRHGKAVRSAANAIGAKIFACCHAAIPSANALPVQ